MHSLMTSTLLKVSCRLKVELASNTAALHSDIDRMKTSIREVEDGLNTWSDEVATLKSAVTALETEVKTWREGRGVVISG